MSGINRRKKKLEFDSFSTRYLECKQQYGGETQNITRRF